MMYEYVRVQVRCVHLSTTSAYLISHASAWHQVVPSPQSPSLPYQVSGWYKMVATEVLMSPKVPNVGTVPPTVWTTWVIVH